MVNDITRSNHVMPLRGGLQQGRPSLSLPPLLSLYILFSQDNDVQTVTEEPI